MNASSDGSRDYEYIFSNGKWTTVITAARASGCTDQVQGETSESQNITRVQTLSMEDKADGNGRTLTQEGPVLSPGWTATHHAIFGQNVPLLSRSHETGALEKRQEADPPNSGVLTQDESRSLDLSNESNTMDHIPEAKSKPDWISGTVFSPDTHWNDHIHEDVQRRFEEAVDDVRYEICSTELEEEKKCYIDPEKGGAVGQTDVFDVQLMSDTAAKTSWKRDSVATTVQSSDWELSGVLWDTVLVRPKINAVLRDMVPVQDSDLSNSLMDVDPAQNTNSEIRQILRDNVSVHPAGCEIKVGYKTQSTGDDIVPVHQAEPKMSSIFGDPQLSDVLGDTVSGHHTNSEIKDIFGDTVPVHPCELILDEKFHRGESEIHGILGDHASCHATVNLPSVDLRDDSGANLLGNDATQRPQDLTVRAKSDAESACCVSEDVVTVDTTTNSADAGQLMPSYRPTTSNQEGIDLTSRGEPVELWVDACPFLEDDSCNLDKWGRCPSSCAPLTCADNTKPLHYPPIERWSSSDSWASALSDWIQSVSVVPEDLSSTKPLTNSQNQSSTAIQDKKPRSSSAVCRKLSDGAETLKDEGTHRDAGVSPEGLQGDAVIEDFQEVTKSRSIHRPSREESDALTGGGSEEEGARNDGALSFSSYSAPECVQDPTVHGESNHLTHEGTESCVFSDTVTTPIAATPEDADSSMPLTPINIGTSFLRLKEEQDASRNLSLAGITDDFKPRTSESGPAGIPPSSFPKSGDVSSEKRGLILPTGDRFVICEENHVAYVTLDLEDVLSLGKDAGYQANHKKDAEMPRKTHKASSKNKDKSSQSQTKTQENVKPEPSAESPKDGEVTVIETIIITEKVTPRTHSKKKKKQAAAKPKESEPLLQVENGAKPKTGKPKAEATANQHEETLQNEPETPKETKKETQSACPPSIPDDDVIKRRRIAGERAGSVPVRTRPQLPAIFRQRKEEDVKQKVQAPAEAPRVLSEIEAAPVAEDPHSVSLWCRFSPIMADSSVTWMKEGKILSEEKKRVGDDARVSLMVLKASSKDLGLYRCSLSGSLGSASTSDYHLTSEVLMELIIPDHDTPAERREVDGDVEDVSCAPLLFKDDILSDQYFGEQQRTSIVTEKSHFGEGMHRKAFRATVRVGMDPAFSAGHSCVLKVHNSIGYGANSNDELVQRNYSLAVEECYVQNTAREYIKAYTDVAKSAESFGEVPEIIPIFLVHRPSNAIPYATLEEELIGDFVKYSVKDGKEINLMRRDSEAGQKCCAFQHWVYAQTEGNLLVTDMQGVGMKLTDVGIATCKKGYKGFKGNCSTSFIDQFKAVHQCNHFCELLGLSSLQPKPKRTAPPKPKAPPSAKKKPFSAALKGKS